MTVFRLGAVIARFVQTLLNAGADRKKMNLMGNSDGAASVALAAKQTHPRVGRLTGNILFYEWAKGASFSLSDIGCKFVFVRRTFH